MSDVQETHSALTSDNITIPYSQHFSPTLDKQRIETTVLPVSNTGMNLSSSERDKQLLPSPYVCTTCNKSFPRKNVLSRHIKLHCDICDILFSRNIELFKHKYTKHSEKVSNKSSNVRNQHNYTRRSRIASNKTSNIYTVTPKQSESSLNDMSSVKMIHFERRNIISITTIYPNEDNDKDIHSFLITIKQFILNELMYQLEEKKKMKWFAVIKAVVTLPAQEGDLLIVTPYFHSDTILEMSPNNLTAHIMVAFAKIMTNFKAFTECEPDCILEKIVHLELDTATYNMI